VKGWQEEGINLPATSILERGETVGPQDWAFIILCIAFLAHLLLFHWDER